MNKTNTWLIRVLSVVLIGLCLITLSKCAEETSLNFLKPTIEDLKYKESDNKRSSPEFAAKRDYADFENLEV